MINNKDNREKNRIQVIRDSPKNKSRVTIEYQFDIENDLLGIGGYGEVYKVRKKNGNMNQTEPEYALKIFNKANFIKDNEKGSRVLTEIKIQRSLNHEHIVKYEHSFEDKKNVYILMEYCGKETLASLIKKRKRLEEYEVRFYMFQVLSVLKYFRREKIVHRDLTLGNIFLKDIKTVKIGDFGFAYKESENEEKIGVVCGTPTYYTPESNNAKYSYKTDIYDFGLCIYYLFGGKPAYKQPLECAELFTTKESFPFNRSLNFSDEAYDLLKQLVTVENQRIDLDKIYYHPFFNCGKGLSKDKFPEYNENNKNQFFKELKELPAKEGLILTLNRIDISNSNTNSQNVNTTPEFQNSKISNEPYSNIRNSSSGKNVSFNINENTIYQKLNKNSNFKNKIKENSKNQTSDFFFENINNINLNHIKPTDESDEIFNIMNNNNLSEEFKSKNAKNDKDYDLNNISSITFQDDNDYDKNKKLIYIDKINDNLIDYCGIGYQLNNKNIGVYFNDNSQLVKIYKKNKYILYFFKEQNNRYTKEKINLPIKNTHNHLEKKIKFLIRIMESFNLKKHKENKPNKENINEDEENIIILKYKYKYNKGISFFLLSNQNIQVNFSDKTKIIFIFGIRKKIVYVDNQGEISTFPITNDNFNNFKCDDKEIIRKINFAIDQINKK